MEKIIKANHECGGEKGVEVVTSEYLARGESLLGSGGGWIGDWGGHIGS